MNAPEITLPVHSPGEAKRLGFDSFTTDIDRAAEPEIFRSIQSGLSSSDACWISVRPGVFQAARRRVDLDGKPSNREESR